MAELDNEALTRIGRITVKFADTELLANNLLWSLTTPTEGWVGPKLSAGESIEWVLTRIERLAPLRLAGEDLAGVNAWVDEVRHVQRERNIIVHSAVGWDEERTEFYAIRLRRGEIGDHRMSKAELAKVEADATQLPEWGLLVLRRVGELLAPDGT